MTRTQLPFGKNLRYYGSDSTVQHSNIRFWPTFVKACTSTFRSTDFGVRADLRGFFAAYGSGKPGESAEARYRGARTKPPPEGGLNRCSCEHTSTACQDAVFEVLDALALREPRYSLRRAPFLRCNLLKHRAKQVHHKQMTFSWI